MKKLLIAVGIFLIGTSSYAQKKNKPVVTALKNEIAVNIGIGVPTGNFAKGNYEDPASGFAKTGFHLSLSGTHYFSKQWGIAAVIGYTQYGAKGLQSLADGYKEDSGTDSTTLNTTNKSSSFSILVGPAYAFSISKKFSIAFRALGGYANTTLTGFKVYYEDYTDNTIMEQKKASGGAFGFQAGIGLKYGITDKLYLSVNTDYFSSSPSIHIDYINYNVNSGRKIDTYNESINGINTTLGIGLSF